MPAALPAREDGASGLTRLLQVIEAEILPRMLLACSRRTSTRPDRHSPDGADVAELARLLLAHDVSMALAFAEMLHQRGAPLERICLDLLAPAARELEQLWEQHHCNYEQLELGLARLQSVLRALSAADHTPSD